MITVVMGPPAAGKTTYIAENKAAGDVVVDFDAMARAMGAESSHEAPDSVGKVVFAARTAAIARIFEGVDADAWIIQSNLNKESLDYWIEGGAKFVIVDPGKETVLERAESDGRPEGTVELIEAWYADPPEVPEEHLKGGVMPRTKTATVHVKAADNDYFDGYASVFDNVDSYGDVIRKGAFDESLKAYGESGAGIPCYWGHRFDDPMMNIGKTVSAVEDEKGLKVRVQLDMDNPNAVQVSKLIKEGRVSQMSFAYDVLEAGFVEVEGREVYELRKLKVHEVSVVTIGANQATSLSAVDSGNEAPPSSAGVDEQEVADEPDDDPDEGKSVAKSADVLALKHIQVADHTVSGYEGVRE